MAATKSAWNALFSGVTATDEPAAPTTAAGTAPPATAANPYQVGNDQIRKTATWLIGALSAVAAILLAGSQVSSIGKLPTDHLFGRLALAGLAAAVAIGCVIFAIFRLSLILAPVTTPLKDLRTEAATPGSAMVDMAAADSGMRAGFPSITELLETYDDRRGDQIEAHARHRSALAELAAAPSGDAKVAATRAEHAADLAEQQADADVAELRRPVVALTQLLGFLTVSRRFEKERSRVVIAAVIGAIAIVTFAWAANPAAPPAGAAAALPARPVSASVFLTPAGVNELSSVLGASCAEESAATGTPGIVLSSSADAAEVVLTGAGACTGPTRITLETRLARIVVADAAATD